MTTKEMQDTITMFIELESRCPGLVKIADQSIHNAMRASLAGKDVYKVFRYNLDTKREEVLYRFASSLEQIKARYNVGTKCKKGMWHVVKVKNLDITLDRS